VPVGWASGVFATGPSDLNQISQAAKALWILATIGSENDMGLPGGEGAQ